MRRFILCAALFLVARWGTAQTVISSLGKEFYCMVMMYYGTPDEFGGFTTNHYNRVYLSSQFAATVTVTVESPAFSQTVVLAPNVTTTIELPFEVEDINPEIPTRQAIHVVADTDISVYVIYHKLYSTDSYMALPITALGNEYVAVCYHSSAKLSNDRNTASEVGVIATQDNSEVTFTPSSTTIGGHPAGVPFSVNLNKGDTYLLYGDPNDESNDLTGTYVESTKPVATFSGHERTGIPDDSGQSRNLLVEQLPPNATLGTSFITVPFYPRLFPKYDYFRLVAAVDSTVVTQDGKVVDVLKSGSYHEFSVETPMQLTTNNPAILAQYSLSSTDNFGNYNSGVGTLNNPFNPWDPSMMIIPPTQQFLSAYTFANCVDAAFQFSYVNIVIRDTSIPSLRLDNKPVVATWNSIPGSGFSYAQVADAQGSHHIEASSPFGIYVYGFGHADAYCNTGGAAFKMLNGLLVTTNDLDFHGVATDTCHDSIIVFGNVGKAPITVWSIWLADSNAGDFTVTGGKPPFSIDPGDSHIVHIRFCPSDVGFRGLATVRFSSNAVERPIITVHGVGKKIGVEPDRQVLDYQAVLVGRLKDSVFTLNNVGTKTADFESFIITGPDAQMFTLQSPIGQFSIAPGASQLVTVRFRPTSLGIKHANIATSGKAGYFAAVDLIGEGVTPSLGAPIDTIDYQVVKVLKTRDSLMTAQSIGKTTASIAKYVITGPDANQFQIINGGGARVLLAGDTMQVNVRFTPTSAGLKTANLAWLAQDDSVPLPLIVLHGVGVYSRVGIYPLSVDYGRVKVNKKRDSALVASNIGIVEAEIHGYAITGTDPNDFQIVQQTTPAVLQTGTNQTVTARFAPLSTGKKQAQLVLYNDGVAPDTIADLFGNATPGSYNVTTKTDTILAHIGDTITVPVRLIGPLDEADITKYRVLLGFDPTMLFPIDVRPDSSWSDSLFAPTMVYTPGLTDVTAASTNMLLGQGTLYYIDMLVLLGDAMKTPLEFNVARYIDDQGDSDVVTTSYLHGLVQLSAVCDTNGFVKTSANPLSLANVTPNPLTSDAVIAFDLPALGPVHCALVDMLGREAVILADGERAAGHYISLLRAGSLPPGAYTLVLQAGRFRDVKRVEIVR